MSSKIVELSALFLLASFVGLPKARADVPPPADYVETCTVAKQQVGGKSCVACSTYYAEVDKCKNQYTPEGYSKACKSWGASAWTEVWCKPGATPGVAGAASIDDDPTNPQGTCSCRIPGGNFGGATGALLCGVAIVGLGLRRRSRK